MQALRFGWRCKTTNALCPVLAQSCGHGSPEDSNASETSVECNPASISMRINSRAEAASSLSGSASGGPWIATYRSSDRLILSGVDLLSR
jgi:hypothetical protein